MTYNLKETFGGSIDRLTTQAGAVLIAGLALFSTLRTAAGQDIFAGIVERILDELSSADFRDDLGPNQLSYVEQVEAELEAEVADLPLALGLDPVIAAVVWLFAYVLGLAVIVVALDAFGNGWDGFEDIEFENVGWKLLNLFLGTLVFGILVLVGLVFLVIPGLLVFIFLLFFPAAIALDDESFFSAFSKSAGVVKRNFLSTLGLILVTILVFIAISIVGSVLGGALPDAPGAVADELFSAIGTAFALALLAQAYVMDAR